MHNVKWNLGIFVLMLDASFLYINNPFKYFVDMLVQYREIQKIMMHFTIGHWFSRYCSCYFQF